jgi:hypothetical protein
MAAGDNFGGNNNPIAHFGLGDATGVETLRVEWPSGQVTELHSVSVRQSLTVAEPPSFTRITTDRWSRIWTPSGVIGITMATAIWTSSSQDTFLDAALPIKQW